MALHLLVLTTFFLLFNSCNTQQEFVFPWPGPLVVPVDNTIVEQADSARIELSDNGTQRSIIIRENVDVILDCTRVVERLHSDNVLVPINTTMVTWFIQRLDTDLQTLVAEETLGESSLPLDETLTQYLINGTHNEILDIRMSTLPTQAIESSAGVYRCMACGMIPLQPGLICNSSTIEKNVRGFGPVIEDGPGVVIDGANRIINVSNDFCLNASNMPTELLINCFHNRSFTITQDPPPVAAWTLNGVPQPDGVNIFILDAGRPALNDRLQIFNDEITSSINDIIGTMVCNLTNPFGFDIATSIINIAPNINEGSGFVEEEDAAVLRIGQETCLSSGAIGGVNIECQNKFNNTIFERMWTKDSVPIDSSDETISSTGPGIYVCTLSNMCGSDSATSVIRSNTSIDSFVGTISGLGTDDGCSRSGAPSGNFDLCPAPGEDVTLTCTSSDTNSTLIMTPGGTSVSSPLIINSIDASAEGEYTCIASNLQCSDVNPTLTIILCEGPMIERSMIDGFVTADSENNITIGQDSCEFDGANRVRINCDALGDFTRTWWRDGVLLPNTNEALLTNVAPGTYTCVLTNECGMDNETTLIYGAPDIDEGSGLVADSLNAIDVGSDVCVDQSLGGDLTIECNLLVGSTPPSPIYMWSKEGDPSFSSSASSIMLDRSDGSIAGSYTCNVTTGPNGECGMDVVTSRVLIPPNIMMTGGFDPNPPGTINIGTDACLIGNLALQCSVVGGTPPITRVWTQDGSMLLSTEVFLPISSGGTYTCSVSNDCPTPSMGTSVITVPPTVSISANITGSLNNGCETPGNMLCPLIGEMVTVSCAVTGTSSYMISGPGCTSNSMDLVINSFQESDAGTYQCTASNPCGSSNGSIPIIFTGTPPIISTQPPGPPTDRPPTLPPNMLINIGQNVCITTDQMVDINCITESGTEPINFIWTRDPDPAVISTMSVLEDVGVGTYNCNATNSFGSDVESSSIFINASIDSFVGTISGLGTDDGCSRSGAPSGNFDLCPAPGEGVTITCTTSGSTSIMTPGGTSVSSPLIINSITASDEGVYTCIASDPPCSDVSLPLTIELCEAPVIERGDGFVTNPLESTMTIGQDSCEFDGANRVRINCDALGDFTITWLRDGVLLLNTEALLINMGPGTYTCVLTNECGMDNETTLIYGVPDIDEGSGLVTDSLNAIDVGSDVCVDQSLGGDLTIECNLLVGSTPPSPIYMWSKEGDPSFSSSASSIMLDRSDGSIAGSYTCNVTTGPNGECGMDVATSRVLIPPNIMMTGGFDPNPPGTINIGTDACLIGNLALQCSVVGGTPPITRVWTQDGSMLLSTEVFLPISSGGTYTCSVSNDCPTPSMGTSVITVPPTVSISANITGSLNNGCETPGNMLCPLIGEMVTISCAVTGTSSYMISGPGGTSNSMDLVINSFQESDAGTYMYQCTASNPCGSSTDTITIIFTGTPPIISTPPPGPPTDRPPTLPPNMLINIGQNVCITTDQMVDINCITESGTEPINFIWTRDPDPAVISNMSVLEDVGVGTYNCNATNSFGSDVESSSIFSIPDLDLQVMITPRGRCDDLREQPSPNVDYCAFLGDTVTILCSSPDTNESGVITPNGETGRREIVDIEESDSGMYNCSLDNACGYTIPSFYLAVFNPAVIDRETPLPPDMPGERNFGAGRSDGPMNVAENVTVQLHCPYSGINEPTTRWLLVANNRTTEIVDMPPDIMLINDTVNRNLTLVINNFREEFEGTYRCDTGNIAGDDEGDVIIYIEEEWTTTPWSSCDPDCHLGTRMRVVTCREVNTHVLLPDSRCIEEKPASMERCIDRGPCFLGPQWVALEWSQCSQDCGGGHRTRNLYCQIRRTGEIVKDSMCVGQLRPHTFEYCNLDPCCREDRYPQFCKLIRSSSFCEKKVFKKDCCWSCR